MALRLRDPRPGKSPNFTIRGTYLGVYVEQSSGTAKRAVARKLADGLERAIERGEWPPKAEARPGDAPTFLTAAVAYLEAGGTPRYVAKLIKHFGETALPAIDQATVDAAALALRPSTTGATRNRCVYTPVSAILRHTLGDAAPQLRRPKGAKGKTRTDFLWPDDAFAIIGAADTIAADFGLYLRMLLYVGTRKSETLAIPPEHVRIDERATWVRETKNGDPVMLRLREDILEPLAAHLATREGERRLFRFRDGGHFKHYLTRAKLAACDLPCPVRRPKGWRPPPHRLSWVGFHTFRHTWATWMRRYGGLDVKGLTDTGIWADERSAARYAHAVAREEWERVDDLPAMANPGKGRGTRKQRKLTA
jgi:integrase